MGNKSAFDKDLEFLYNCSNDNLKLLVDILIYNKKGKQRLTEELTRTKGFREAYPNNIKKIIPLVIDELQRYGGNTFSNAFRGHGVEYKEILIKVCKQCKVNFNKDASAELLERYLLQKILSIAADKMTDEDVMHLGEIHTKTKDMLKKNISSFHLGDPLIFKMTTTLVIRIANKREWNVLAEYLSKFVGGRFYAVLTGPIGLAISAVWTAWDFAGPAYRVLVPATIAIAYFRMVSDKTEDELNRIFN